MASSAPRIVEIELRKGQAGLGFNIRGGTDNIHIGTDPGIFVTTIKSSGAAAQDGTLQIGDKILEVNGTSLREVMHKDAVRCFQESGDLVKMVVEKDAEARIKETLQETNPEPESSPSPTVPTLPDHSDSDRPQHTPALKTLLIIAAAAAVAATAAIVTFSIFKNKRH